jgi:predicted membrane protein
MRNIIGIFFIALGVIAFLDISDLMQIQFWDLLWGWFPILFVAIGTHKLIQNKESIISSTGIIIIGLVWLGSNLDILPFGVWDIILPGIFILMGLYLLIGMKKRSRKDEQFDEGDLNIESFFSGVKERVLKKEITGGRIDCIMGGVDLDLRTAIVKGEVSLEINVIMGGVKLLLPNDVQIITKGKPFFGGVKGNYVNNPVSENKLIIKNDILLGGIDIYT